MKNKRLLVILLVFIFLGGAAVATAVVFRVEKVDITFRSNIEYIQDETAALTTYQSAISYVKGKNILFGVSEKEIIEKIEASDPLVKCTNIERKFPNKLEIRVRERYPMYFFTYGTGGEARTAVMDATLRIVTDDAEKINQGREDSQKLINITDQFAVTAEFADFEIGEQIQTYCTGETDETKAQLLVDMSLLFAEQKLYEDALNHLFSTITLDDYIGGVRMIMVLRSGYITDGGILEIEIRNTEFRFADKLKAVWNILENYSNYQPGSIVAENGEDGKILSMWLPAGDTP